MSGRYSQQKGKRGELHLCTQLRALKYTEVSRIPHWLKGKHNQDVWGKDPETGALTTFENKELKRLPHWFNKLSQSKPGQSFQRNGRFAFGNCLVAYGLDFDEVKKMHDVIFDHPATGQHLLKRWFTSFYKKVQGADYLTMRSYRGPRWWFKFYGPWNE